MHPHEVLTQYFITGQLASSPQVAYSANRGEASARLSSLYKFAEQTGLNPADSSMFVASAGELTNNCFDHNLGHWTDPTQPGCATSWSSDSKNITFGVADRGRGIISSLHEVVGKEKTPQQVLAAAFEQIVSGRSPEKRGNGLKFVRNAILASSRNSLKCFSNNHSYQIGSVVLPAPMDLNTDYPHGTLIFFQWGL